MRIAVIGANGQLGSDVVRAFENNGDDVCPMTHAEIEIENIDSVSRGLRDIDPQAVVNTAAMHHVENLRARARKGIRRKCRGGKKPRNG